VARIVLPSPGQPFATITPTDEGAITAFERTTLIDLYQRHGALLFRGFGVDLDSFGRFARSLCRTAVVNETPGRSRLDAAKALYSVDGGSNAFALHPELSREPWKPDAAMFCCLSPPRAGGATTLCDGIALAEALPREVREGLEDRRLVYLKATWPEQLRFWLGTDRPDDTLLRSPPPECPYRFTRLPNGRVARFFTRPALHRPMFAEGPAFGNFLLFARFNNGNGHHPLLDDMTPVPEEWLQAIKATGDRLAVAIEWQQGDVLVLDNTRFLHGRTAITDPAERRIATFFGYLDFARPDPEEPADPIWRRADFCPPAPPSEMLRAN
jgi:alpha-ketoglutarate-dependent taurine dioxygenase